MAQENVPDQPDQTAKPRYTVVVFKEGATGATRTFSFSRKGLAISLASTILVLILLTLAGIVYTPVGTYLPIIDKEKEKRYGNQILDIQKQVLAISQEMEALRGYNLRLRTALGETLSAPESVAMASAAPDSTGASASPVGAVSKTARTPVAGAEEPAGAGKAALEVPLTVPADGFITKSFEPGQFHYGIDIAGKPGTGVLAAADGRVLFAGWTYDDGFSLMIAHAEGFVTVYKHNQSVLKNTGAPVKRGELIALMGNTGRTSSGTHLHFEVWRDGVPDNPQQYLLTTQ
jgi:murein DD-endopeptidase MepM/ murein hydrolase activator NlpD